MAVVKNLQELKFILKITFFFALQSGFPKDRADVLGGN